MEIKVSIIIPIYNAARFIERCLLSALNQSYKSIEYILVDDGSTDDSLRIIKDLILGSPRGADVHLVLHEVNRGVAIARNTGLNASSGDYIYFLDSDDELPLNAIEILVEKLGNTNADIVIGEFSLTGTDKTGFKTTKLPDGHYEKERILDSFLLMQWPDMTCNKLVRLKTIRDHTIFFEKKIIHEDTLWSFMLAVRSSLMLVCNQITYIYHIQGQSITQKKTDHNFNSLFYVLSKIVDISIAENLFRKDVHIKDYLIDYCFYYFKESVRCRTERDKSRITFAEINSQLDRIGSITEGISRSSQIKLALLKSPFGWAFLIFKTYLFLKGVR